jgi:trimeric autotransporter adhesin
MRAVLLRQHAHSPNAITNTGRVSGVIHYHGGSKVDKEMFKTLCFLTLVVLPAQAWRTTKQAVNGSCSAANSTASSTAPRNLCSAGTASAVAGSGPWTWVCSGSNGGTSSSCAAQPSIPIGASAFVASLGVNTHLSYSGTPYYGNPQSVLTALQYLGINTIRETSPIFEEDSTTIATDDALAAAGVKFDALMLGDGVVNVSGTLSSLTSFEKSYSGSISSIEAPNEINAWPISYDGITNTTSAGIAVTEALWSSVKGNPPIYAPTLSDGESNVLTSETALGNLAPYVSYGNVHIYACCSNNVWQYDMPYWLPVLQKDTLGRLPVVTETGYQTGPSSVDDLSAAKYTLNLLLENALNGIARTYLFELADESSSYTYGQFNVNWTPKTGATAIHNLTSILQAAGSGRPSSAPQYSVSGLPATGHSLILGSSSVFDLAVWVDATVYNPSTETDITAQAYTATVKLGATYPTVKIFDPMTGTAPIETYSNVSSIQVSVSDHPLIVQF